MANASQPVTASGKTQVFISYAREDRPAAEKLAAELKKRGVGIWLDTEQLQCGENWSDAIREAVEQCGFAVIILSQASARPDRFISKEWAVIQESCWRRPELPVCVLLVDGAKVPPFLREWRALPGKKESDLEFAAEEIRRQMMTAGYWKAESDWEPAAREREERFGEIRTLLADSKAESSWDVE